MSKLMSVAMTTDAVIERRKLVSRRTNWWRDRNGRKLLVPGDTLTLCRKVQGRKPGEPIERLAEVRVTDVRRERLDEITEHDVLLEGFRWAKGDLDPWGFERRGGTLGLPVEGSIVESFIRLYLAGNGGTPDQVVTRIEWDYLDTPVTTVECSRPGENYRLFDHTGVLDVHLAAGRGGGTGPCICGFDRHRPRIGFSVGGGTTGSGVRHERCELCAERAAGRPVRGLHGAMFADVASAVTP